MSTFDNAFEKIDKDKAERLNQINAERARAQAENDKFRSDVLKAFTGIADVLLKEFVTSANKNGYPAKRDNDVNQASFSKVSIKLIPIKGSEHTEDESVYASFSIIADYNTKLIEYKSIYDQESEESDAHSSVTFNAASLGRDQISNRITDFLNKSVKYRS